MEWHSIPERYFFDNFNVLATDSLPIDSYIDVNVLLLEHGELLAALVDDMPSRAEPDWVDLGLLVHVDKSLFQDGHLESEILEKAAPH
jgi:hypothetical protein